MVCFSQRWQGGVASLVIRAFALSKMVGQNFRGGKTVVFWCLAGLDEVYGSIMPIEEYCVSEHAESLLEGQRLVFPSTWCSA